MKAVIEEVPPLARGEHYRKLYLDFTRQGSLVSMANNHVIIRRVSFADMFEYGLGCFRCGRVSWNPEDVSYKHCESCRIFHES